MTQYINIYELSLLPFWKEKKFLIVRVFLYVICLEFIALKYEDFRER